MFLSDFNIINIPANTIGRPPPTHCNNIANNIRMCSVLVVSIPQSNASCKMHRGKGIVILFLFLGFWLPLSDVFAGTLLKCKFP